MSAKARLDRAYAVVHGAARIPGAVKWFRQRLEDAGVKVGKTSLYRYVNGEREMPEAVEAVLRECQQEAVDILKTRMRQLR